jgi:hypothetical protein
VYTGTPCFFALDRLRRLDPASVLRTVGDEEDRPRDPLRDLPLGSAELHAQDDGVADGGSLTGRERVERGLNELPIVGRGTPTAARVAKETTPTRYFSGTSARNVFAAARAASSRVGSTSFAFIERDTSIASTTVASSRGTLTVACGRATPKIIIPRPTRSRIRGR